MRKYRISRLLFIAALCVLLPSFAFAQSITIQGRVTDSSGTALTGGAVLFHVQILTPDANRCVLYDETQPQDLSRSNGFFSLNLNSGTSTKQVPLKYGLEEALSNRSGFAIDAGYCKNTSAAANYIPSSTSNRKIIIEFKDPGFMTNFEAMAEMDLNPVPYAIESRFVGGFESSSFVRVADGGVPATAPIFSSAQVSELTKLIGGTSDNYMSSTNNGTGAKLPGISGAPGSLSKGAMWFDTVSNVLKYYDGTAVQTVGAGGGGGSGITSITVTAGELTGGGSGSTVNLGLPNVATAGTYGSSSTTPQIEIDNKGRVRTVNLLPISGTLPGAGPLGEVLRSDGSNWASGLLRTADIRSTSDQASIFPATSCSAGQFLTWNSVSDKLLCTAVSLPAPGTTANTYKIVNVDANGLVTGGSSPTSLDGFGISDGVRSGGVPKISTGNDTALPATAMNGELLVATNSHKIYRYDGAAWAEISSATATGLADVLVAGGALVKSGSGATPTITLPAADASTNGFLSSAKFTEFTNKLTNALASAHIFVGNGGGVATDVPASGDVALDNTGKFTVTGIRGVDVTAGVPVDGQILRYAAAAYSPGFLTMGDLRSTVTGTRSLTVGCTASETLTWNSGTDSLQCSSIGNLSASTISSGTLGVANGGTGATSLTGAGIFVNGGNSFGAAASLGTNDNFPLSLKANGTNALTVSGSGNIGVGTSAPSTLLHARSDQAAETILRLENASADPLAGALISLNADVTGAALAVRSSTFAGAAARGRPNGLSLFTANAATGGISLAARNAAGIISLHTGGDTERMRIDAAGNVGIGTSIPGTMLDVNGQAATIRGTASLPGELRFNATNAGTTYVGFKGPGSNPASSVLWQLPAGDGTNGQVLSTNGSGALSWVSGNAGSVTSITAGTGLTGGTITGSGTIGLGTELAGLNGLSTTGVLKRTGAGTFTAGQASLTADVSGVLPLTNGGTNAALSAVSGGVAYSTASAMAFTAAGSAGQMLRSNGAAAPAWSMATFPNTAAIGDLLYASSANTWSSLARANTAALVTSSTGVPSWVSGATANRLLRTDGSSITFAQASLATDVTGTLPVANGGTGATTAADKTVFAAPTGGGAPSFRALTSADLPASASYWQAGSNGINYAGGNVGIGTNNPTAQLHVENSSGDATWRIKRTSGSDLYVNSSTIASVLGTAGATDLQLRTNNTPRFTISSGGNVGIGTTSPGALLDVASQNGVIRSLDNGAGGGSFPAVEARNYGLNHPIFVLSNARGTSASPTATQMGDTLGAVIFKGQNDSTTDTQAARIEAKAETNFSSGVAPTALTFSTAGASGIYAERARIASNGNVGVGTTNPTANIHVSSAGSVTEPQLRLNDTSGYPRLIFSKSDTDRWTLGGDDSYFNIYDNANNLNRFTILPNGNIGIGTTAPNARLVVASTSSVPTPLLNTLAQFAGPNGAATRLELLSAGAANTVFLRRANGTYSSPTGLQSGDYIGGMNFSGYGTSAYGSPRAQIFSQSTEAWTDTAQGANLVFTTSANGTTANSERLRIDHNGNVGIGTTAPAGTMHVAGGTYNLVATNTDFALNTTGSALTVGPGATSGNTFYSIHALINGGANGGNLVLQRYGGNVGIGTTNPGYKLDVQGGDINTSGSVRANGVALSSDIRYKKDVQALDHALDRLLNIHGVSYRWRTEEFPDKHFNDRTQVGVIAQEVEAQFPELVDTNPKGYKSVNYPALVAPIIEALRELADRLHLVEERQAVAQRKDAKVQALEGKVNELDARNRELEARNRALEARLQRIEESLTPASKKRSPASVK